MSRIARVVVPGVPHHVIQRGNRRQKVFFSEADMGKYLRIFEDQADRCGLAVWAYCLMDNHVHFVIVPAREDSLAKGMGETHRRYTRMIHFREGWRGYLWQGRFLSFPMSDEHVYRVLRYVEMNPVRARMAGKAEEYKWSSARAHVEKKRDRILSKFSFIEAIEDWRKYLMEESEEDVKVIREHSFRGRPWGGDDFIRQLEKQTGRMLRKQKPGPKRRS